MWKTEPPALMTDGTPIASSASWVASSSLRRAARTAMSPGTSARPSKVAPLWISRLMSWAASVMTCSRHSGHRGLGPRTLAELAAAYDPEPERLARTRQSRLAVVRLDGVYGDARIAEGRALEHGLEPVEQGLVGAPVDPERLGGARGVGRREVGDDVAAAEGVDGLLGVADQHHRGRVGEGALEDLPLHGVGVLELVDQHELPAPAHARAGRGVERRRARRRAG